MKEIPFGRQYFSGRTFTSLRRPTIGELKSSPRRSGSVPSLLTSGLLTSGLSIYGTNSEYPLGLRVDSTWF